MGRHTPKIGRRDTRRELIAVQAESDITEITTPHEGVVQTSEKPEVGPYGLNESEMAEFFNYAGSEGIKLLSHYESQGVQKEATDIGFRILGKSGMELAAKVATDLGQPLHTTLLDIMEGMTSQIDTEDVQLYEAICEDFDRSEQSKVIALSNLPGRDRENLRRTFYSGTHNEDRELARRY